MTAVDAPPDLRALADELELLVEHDPAACARRAADGVAVARAGGDDDAEMRLSFHAAFAHHLLGEDAAALAAAERAEELAEAREDLVWRSRALACRGLVHHELGDVEDAVDLLTRAVDLRREANDPVGTAELLHHLGTVYTGMVQFAPQAAQVLTEARRLWLAAGETDRAAVALTSLARTFVVTGRRLAETNPRGALAAVRQALDIARRAVDEADATGLSSAAVEARLATAGAHLLGRDLPAAEAVLATARDMLARFPSPRQQIALHRLTSRWLVLAGRAEDAVGEARAGLALCERLDRPAERVELLRVLVEAHEARCDLGDALDALHDLHDLTTRLADAVAERRAELLSSRLEIERAQRAAESERRRAQALEERNARLAYEATHDALTGLANRRVLDAHLLRLTGERARFAVALLDVDHFKRVNDRWSHQVGDQVLARLARVLEETLRGDDLPARYGGEEFALVLGDVDAETAVAVCERVRRAVADTDWTDLMPGGTGVTVSLGVVASDAHGTPEGLLTQADAALYGAKEGGRDRVCLAG